jgi:hypothetical protein
VQKQQETQDGHLTTGQAATLLQVSADTVRRNGARLGRKVLGRWRLDPERVAAELAGGESR